MPRIRFDVNNDILIVIRARLIRRALVRLSYRFSALCQGSTVILILRLPPGPFAALSLMSFFLLVVIEHMEHVEL